MNFYGIGAWRADRIEQEPATPMGPLTPPDAMLFEDDPTPRHVERMDVEDVEGVDPIEAIGERHAERFRAAIDYYLSVRVDR